MAMHRNGGTAVTFDQSTGEGSVFNEHGHLLCSISTRDQSATIAMPEGQDQVLHRNDTLHHQQTDNHSWEFGDMKVQFIPSTWDLVVSVTNSVGECQFSTITGPQIVSCKTASTPAPSATTNTVTTPSSDSAGKSKKTSTGVGKPRSGGIKFDLPSAEGKDLASLNADLDIMLANIKSISKAHT